MESRFGHDFSHVRVHDDGAAADSARSAGALAFTTGPDIFFGSNQYQPRNLAGRALIAHELAHTIQQQNSGEGSAAENSGLERIAERAAISATLGTAVRVSPASQAPAVQFRKVTSGGFGEEVERFMKEYSLPDAAVDVMQNSATFMRLAATLDKHYVSWLTLGLYVGPDGVISKGPAGTKGKRSLMIEIGPVRFVPVGSADNLWDPDDAKNQIVGDRIYVLSANVPQFVQELAHEATHASRFVTGAMPAPKDLADAVRLGLEDEIAARKSEAAVVGELPAKDRKDALPVGSLKDRDIQRDLSPGFDLTYLELFFFNWEMKDAKKADNVTDEEALDMQKQAQSGKSIVLRRPRTRDDIFRSTRYGTLLRDRKTCADDWIQFGKVHKSTDPDFAKEKEALLQKHAKNFFGGKVAYLP